MSDVHFSLAIPAADFEEYVELTRTALQTVITDTTVSEITQFYQIFEAFRETNTSSTICNQPDCQTTETVFLTGIDEPISFVDSYVATSATSLTFDNTETTFSVTLHYIAANATDCTTTLLDEIAPGGPQPVDLLKFPETGVYYVFQVTGATVPECILSTTGFTKNVLIVDYTLAPVVPLAETPVVEPPVSMNATEPIAAPNNATEPIAAPNNTTEPIAEAPVSNTTVPLADEPVSPPLEAPVAAPVEAPVETPVAVPVAAVPVAAPVDSGNVTPSAANEFSAGGYIAGIVILVLIVIGLLIAVIVLGVKLRRNNTVVVA